MSEKMRINFQLFAEHSDTDIELMRAYGLDPDGNPLTEENNNVDAEDNPIGPPGINETPLTPENTDNSEVDSQTQTLENPDDDPELTTERTPSNEGTPLILGRFRNQEELERAYLEQQNFVGRQSNEIGELRRRLKVQNSQPVTAPTTGMFDGVSNDELLTSLTNDPKKFFEGLFGIAFADHSEKMKNEIFASVERDRFAERFLEDNGDFPELREEFYEISERIPDPQDALDAVRGRRLRNLDNIFSDTRYIAGHIQSPGMQSILSDVSIVQHLGDKVKERIISEYLSTLKKARSDVKLISDADGGTPATAPKHYDSFHDMTDDAVDYLKSLIKK